MPIFWLARDRHRHHQCHGRLHLSPDNIDNPYIGLVKLGPNTLVLSGRNFYFVGTTVTAGTLEAKYPVSLPGYNVSGNVNVASGAMLAVNVGGSNEWNSYSTTSARCSATWAFGAVPRWASTPPTPPAAFTLSDNISGVQGLAKLGPNTLVLTGTNTYSGGTTISAGTFEAKYTFALSPYGHVTVAWAPCWRSAWAAATAATSGTPGQRRHRRPARPPDLDLQRRLRIGHRHHRRRPAFPYSGNIGGIEGLTKLGPNTLMLNGSNTYTGDHDQRRHPADGQHHRPGQFGGRVVEQQRGPGPRRYSPTIGVLTGSGTVTNTYGSSTSTLTLAPAAATTFSGVLTMAPASRLGLSGSATKSSPAATPTPAAPPSATARWSWPAPRPCPARASSTSAARGP